jgi:hypothetical protein
VDIVNKESHQISQGFFVRIISESQQATVIRESGKVQQSAIRYHRRRRRRLFFFKSFAFSKP